jgi:hypothetical protein
VKIEISRDGGTTWTAIITSTANDGDYSWTVAAPASANSRIRITSTTMAAATDTSNAAFTLQMPVVNLTSPNGGETWTVGSVHPITWTSDVIGNLRIEVSRDGGVTWTTLTSSAPNTGTYNWTVTSPPTATALIRITSVSVAGVTDTSNAVFVIL